VNRYLRALLGFNLGCIPTLFYTGPRGFARSCLRAFDSTGYPLGIPEITLGEILKENRPEIRMTTGPYEDGMMPYDQALVLLSVLVAEKPDLVLEIGTFMGHTTKLMASNLESVTIHTVDLPEEFSAKDDPVKSLAKDDFHLIQRRRVGKEYLGQPCASRIIQHFADSATWDFRNAGNPTFFFIDGSHTYDYCKSDTEKAFAIAKHPSVFFWHDCDAYHPGVVQFLVEWRKQGRDIRRVKGTPLAYWKSS